MDTNTTMSGTMALYYEALSKVLKKYNVEPNFHEETQTLTGGMEWKSNGGRHCETFITITEKEEGVFEVSCEGVGSTNQEITNPDESIAWLRTQLNTYDYEIRH